MKVYVKPLERCDQCPAISYIHFDGEGESCPYEYMVAKCSLAKKDLSYKDIIEVGEEISRKPGYIPQRKFPKWCPLPDF